MSTKGDQTTYDAPVCMRPSPAMLSGLQDLLDTISMSHRGTAVEIGTYSGESAVIIAPRFEHLYCIDPYVAVDGQPMGRGIVEGMFDARTRSVPNLTKIVARAEDVVGQFGVKNLDFVYIDADHLESTVRNQIRLYAPAVSKGGFIGGHDYNQGPVKRAFDLEMALLGATKLGEYRDFSVLFKLP